METEKRLVALVVNRTTLLSDQRGLACSLHQMATKQCIGLNLLFTTSAAGVYMSTYTNKF